MAAVQVEFEGKVYPSIKDAAEALGVSHSYIGTRINSDNYPEWKRVEPVKPRSEYTPDKKAMINIRSTQGRKQIFQTCAEILGIEPADWIEGCIRTLALNTVSYLESEAGADIDPDLLREGIAKHWNRQARIGNIPADAFD